MVEICAGSFTRISRSFRIKCKTCPNIDNIAKEIALRYLTVNIKIIWISKLSHGERHSIDRMNFVGSKVLQRGLMSNYPVGHPNSVKVTHRRDTTSESRTLRSSGTHQGLWSKLCGHFDFSSSILLVSLSQILFPTLSLFISLQLSFSLSPSISLILSRPKRKNRLMWYWYILFKEYVSNIHMKMLW